MKTINKELEILNTPLSRSELSQPISGTWKNVTRNQVITIEKELTLDLVSHVRYTWNECPNGIYNYSTPKSRLLRCFTKIK
jgi:hypothetical protein